METELDFIAPLLPEYEIINGLIIAKKIGRVAEETIISAINGFFRLEIKIHNLSGLYPEIIS
jgi:hypothetical protein